MECDMLEIGCGGMRQGATVTHETRYVMESNGIEHNRTYHNRMHCNETEKERTDLWALRLWLGDMTPWASGPLICLRAPSLLCGPRWLVGPGS